MDVARGKLLIMRNTVNLTVLTFFIRMFAWVLLGLQARISHKLEPHFELTGFVLKV